MVGIALEVLLAGHVTAVIVRVIGGAIQGDGVIPSALPGIFQPIRLGVCGAGDQLDILDDRALGGEIERDTGPDAVQQGGEQVDRVG